MNEQDLLRRGRLVLVAHVPLAMRDNSTNAVSCSKPKLSGYALPTASTPAWKLGLSRLVEEQELGRCVNRPFEFSVPLAVRDSAPEALTVLCGEDLLESGPVYRLQISR